MANSEHLAILNQGVNAWNEWRQKARGRIDLQDAELSGKDLTGIDFGVKRKAWRERDRRSPNSNPALCRPERMVARSEKVHMSGKSPYPGG